MVCPGGCRDWNRGRTYSPSMRPMTSKIGPIAIQPIKDGSSVCAVQGAKGLVRAKLVTAFDFEKGSQVQILSARPMRCPEPAQIRVLGGSLRMVQRRLAKSPRMASPLTTAPPSSEGRLWPRSLGSRSRDLDMAFSVRTVERSPHRSGDRRVGEVSGAWLAVFKTARRVVSRTRSTATQPDSEGTRRSRLGLRTAPEPRGSASQVNGADDR